MRKKKEKKKANKNTINIGQYILSATPKGSARTLLGPIKHNIIESKTWDTKRKCNIYEGKLIDYNIYKIKVITYDECITVHIIQCIPCKAYDIMYWIQYIENRDGISRERTTYYLFTTHFTVFSLKIVNWWNQWILIF